MTFHEFLNKYKIRLSRQQLEAAQAIEGPVLLLAVPGSGKTTVLVTRLGYMIYGLGIDPEHILTVTYTVAATRDMAARYVSIFGEEYAGRLEFRTINGICARIIQYCGKLLGKTTYELVTEEKLLSELLIGIYREVMKEYPTESDIKALRTRITYAKNMMLTQAQLRDLDEEDIPYSEIYMRYCSELKARGWMDYDDQMVYAYRLLKAIPEALEFFRSRYQYICVDEAQDTSKIQHAIISLLVGERGNLFMVGDEDQSIYGFRAAYPEALMSFGKEHPGAKILLMEDNFRSTGQIVAAAGKFIKKNIHRYEKNMRPSREEGSAIREIPVKSRKGQYNYLLKVAENCTEETAILYRDNESALPLVDLLERRGIPYRIRTADYTFFSNRVVTDILNIIKFAMNPTDTELFSKIYFKIGTYLNKAAMEELCENSVVYGCHVLAAAPLCKKLHPQTVKSCKAMKTHMENLLTERADKGIYRIVHFMGYGDYLERMKIKDRQVDILEALGENIGTVAQLPGRLEELQQLLLEKENDVRCPLILSTIHSSKGLEYDTVYLMDAFDGIFPERVIKDMRNAVPEDVKAYEEERRLFYVGATRSKNHLNIFTMDKQSSFAGELFDMSQEDYERFCCRIQVRQSISHKKYGQGVVQYKNGDIVTVLFAEGEKKLSMRMLMEKKLLV
ncbi:MAG: ATP-dependent helicase [Lachnospiraceae bacterium]|nr:ATP-dependent helicase [Lachnospiraceae bacterium]